MLVQILTRLLLDKMVDEIFEAMMAVEEANERDSKITHTLNQCENDLVEQVNEK